MPRTQLSWRPGFSLARKPMKKPGALRTKRGASLLGSAHGPKQFEFITEVPASFSCYESRRSPSATPTHPGAAAGPLTDSNARASSEANNVWLVSDNHRHYFPIGNCEETEFNFNTPLWTLDDNSSLIGGDEFTNHAI